MGSETAKVESIGTHLLLDYFECDPEILKDNNALEKLMVEAAKTMGATILDTSFKDLFAPFGVSGVIIIGESHLSIHTWPEYGYAAVDFFTCGKKIDPWKAHPLIKQGLSSNRTSMTELKRGFFDVPAGDLPHKLS